MHARLTTIVVAGVLFGASSASAEPKIVGDRLNNTAYTLRGGEVSLGVMSEEVGVLNEITVGTYLAPWFAFPFLKAPIPTAFVKVRDWFFGPVTLSVRGAIVAFNADALSSELTGHRPASSGLTVFPIDVTTSVRFSDRFTQSLGLNYTLVSAGLDAPSTTSIAGAADATTTSLTALSELRLTKVFALTLLARVLVWRGALHVKSDVTEPNLALHADIGTHGGLHKGLFCIVPGVSFHWKHVGLELGVGYGVNWIPFVELPIDSYTVVPQGDFFFRF
ncbi:MAG TPA: hypothetical protein VF407_02890 [Polyangiaceae bacterium]